MAKLYSTKDAAQLLGVTPGYVRTLYERGELPALKLGVKNNHLRIDLYAYFVAKGLSLKILQEFDDARQAQRTSDSDR